MTTQGEDQANAILVAVQIQLGKIEGILQTVVTEHARRISDNEEVSRKLRTDLTAVKDESAKAVLELSDKIQRKWDESTREGMKAYSELMGTQATHTSAINDIREDVRTVQEKQHNGLSRAAIIVSPIIALIALVWTIYINHH